MLDADSSAFEHSLQNIVLILLSLALLPLDTFLAFWSYIFGSIFQSKVTQRRNANRNKPYFKARTILVTGVGMTKGLSLARLFYEAGHDVIGADFEGNGIKVCGRVSKSLRKFIPLRKPNAQSGSEPYVQGLLDIITSEKVDLWVSCSGVASAVEDGEAKQIIETRTSCRAIQFDVKTTQTLHEKHTFIAYTEEIGLTAPETHTIMTRAAVDAALRKAPAGRKYIMKTVGVIDAARGDMTLLPKATEAETAKHLDRLDISEKSPWILQQFIDGKEYCTHSVVIRGEVKAFLACPSAELLMHYELLPPESKLNKAMLEFTQKYAKAGGETFTGHLSFDFLVYQEELDQLTIDPAAKVTLYPIECNPRAHTAVALFNGTTAMVDAYLSLLDPKSKSQSQTQSQSSKMGTSVNGTGVVQVGSRITGVVTPVEVDPKYFWVGHDLVNLILLPLLSFLTLRRGSSFMSIVVGIDLFLDRLVFWKDGTYELWDPLPWWWLYHVYWPMQFWNALKEGRRWSRLNVSTCKVFEC